MIISLTIFSKIKHVLETLILTLELWVKVNLNNFKH